MEMTRSAYTDLYKCVHWARDVCGRMGVYFVLVCAHVRVAFALGLRRPSTSYLDA